MTVTKCDRYYYIMRQLFYYKMRQKFITKCVRFFIAKCDSFITNATVFTNCDDFIIEGDSYYKMRPLLQITTVYIVSKRFLL